MSYRARFEAVVAKIRACPALTLHAADLGPPTAPSVVADARRRAGGAWPGGMAQLYDEVSFVRIAYSFVDAPSDTQTGGAIDLPPVDQVWDHEAHEDEIWFSDPELDNADLRLIRPIDRFVPEQYAVLYPVPSATPAKVYAFDRNSSLTPTGLSYAQWLDLLLVSHGAYYWLRELCVARDPEIDPHFYDNFDRVARVLGFDPTPYYCTISSPWIDTVGPGRS
jgi:hypothetical protein